MSASATMVARDSAAEIAYEHLRQSVSDSTFGGHFGLALLMREGMASWMAHAPTRITTPSPKGPVERDAAPAGDEFHASVVRVLASMALAQKEERKTA